MKAPIKKYLLILILSQFLPFSVIAAERFPWKLETKYNGQYSQTKQKLEWLIPNLVRQTMIDVSVRLGLQFEDGWAHPLTIGFADTTPLGAENVLAYVQAFEAGGHFQQILMINVAAYERQNFNFEQVFAHELIHAMINDAIGGEAVRNIPVWLHEGLAVFGANQGERMLKTYVHQFYGFAEQNILNGLEGPHGGADYAEDYLAIRYLYEKKGVNVLRNFVREVVDRKGDIPGSLKYTALETWPEFQKNVREFSVEVIKQIGPPRRGEETTPY